MHQKCSQPEQQMQPDAPTPGAHISIHRQIYVSPLNNGSHYGMPEVLTRLANPRRCLNARGEEVPFLSFRAEASKGEITALIQCLSDTGADPLIQAAPVCLLQPASLPASPRHPTPTTTHEHTPEPRHQLLASAVSQTWSCVFI